MAAGESGGGKWRRRDDGVAVAVHSHVQLQYALIFRGRIDRTTRYCTKQTHLAFFMNDSVVISRK